jgi:MFS family permease
VATDVFSIVERIEGIGLWPFMILTALVAAFSTLYGWRAVRGDFSKALAILLALLGCVYVGVSALPSLFFFVSLPSALIASLIVFGLIIGAVDVFWTLALTARVPKERLGVTFGFAMVLSSVGKTLGPWLIQIGRFLFPAYSPSWEFPLIVSGLFALSAALLAARIKSEA